jgi:hypothetical protein
MCSSVLSLTSVLSGFGLSVPRFGRPTPGRNPVPIVWETGCAPGPVWTDGENLASTGIRSQDRSACSESLYQLLYPSPRLFSSCKITFSQINWYVFLSGNIRPWSLPCVQHNWCTHMEHVKGLNNFSSRFSYTTPKCYLNAVQTVKV